MNELGMVLIIGLLVLVGVLALFGTIVLVFSYLDKAWKKDWYNSIYGQSERSWTKDIKK